jgi:hypothetical protein
MKRRLTSRNLECPTDCDEEHFEDVMNTIPEEWEFLKTEIDGFWRTYTFAINDKQKCETAVILKSHDA